MFLRVRVDMFLRVRRDMFLGISKSCCWIELNDGGEGDEEETEVMEVHGDEEECGD